MVSATKPVTVLLRSRAPVVGLGSEVGAGGVPRQREQRVEPVARQRVVKIKTDDWDLE